jgi:hypothetical protein
MDEERLRIKDETECDGSELQNAQSIINSEAQLLTVYTPEQRKSYAP